MINLNQLNEKKLLSKDILLSYINDFDVYKFYSNIPDLSLNLSINFKIFLKFYVS